MVAPFDHEATAYAAKLAEKTERYDDMAEAMKKVAETVDELTADERNLLSVGYRKKIDPRRDSWRILQSIVVEEKSEVNINRIIEYRKKVEGEMTGICREVLSILDDHLIPSTKVEDPAGGAFYFKMRGDYLRYLAEISIGIDRSNASEESVKEYESATIIARVQLPPTHPIRLGVALNFSVFYYEILFSPHMACEIAIEAFDEAISGLGSLNEEEFKASFHIMQRLLDNVILWEAEMSQEAGYNIDNILPAQENVPPKAAAELEPAMDEDEEEQD